MSGRCGSLENVRTSIPLSTLKIGVKLTRLSPKQSEYLGVPVDGPYKSEHLPVLRSAATCGSWENRLDASQNPRIDS